MVALDLTKPMRLDGSDLPIRYVTKINHSDGERLAFVLTDEFGHDHLTTRRLDGTSPGGVLYAVVNAEPVQTLAISVVLSASGVIGLTFAHDKLAARRLADIHIAYNPHTGKVSADVLS